MIERAVEISMKDYDMSCELLGRQKYHNRFILLPNNRLVTMKNKLESILKVYKNVLELVRMSDSNKRTFCRRSWRNSK